MAYCRMGEDSDVHAMSYWYEGEELWEIRTEGWGVIEESRRGTLAALLYLKELGNQVPMSAIRRLRREIEEEKAG